MHSLSEEKPLPPQYTEIDSPASWLLPSPSLTEQLEVENIGAPKILPRWRRNLSKIIHYSYMVLVDLLVATPFCIGAVYSVEDLATTRWPTILNEYFRLGAFTILTHIIDRMMRSLHFDWPARLGAGGATVMVLVLMERSTVFLLPASMRSGEA